MDRQGSITILVAAIIAALAWSRSGKKTDHPSPTTPQAPFTRFSYVPGIFQHDSLPTGPENGFRAKTLPRLGIVDQIYDDAANNDKAQWEKLRDYLEHLNSIKPVSERFKVVFVARHGEGIHNVKEREVGRQQWDQYWSRLEGDGHLEWLDPPLTEIGIQQARDVGAFWEDAISSSMVCAPTSFYTSPLRRCLQTTQATWNNARDLLASKSGSLNSKSPVIAEALREIFGVHTCDKRRNSSQIRAEYPDFVLASNVSDEDVLWTPHRRETLEEHAKLWHGFLVELFDKDNSTYVALTTHSGATRALYLAIGHPDVWTATGSVIPILVRAQP